MPETYVNDDGVLVVVAPAVVLESTSDLGDQEQEEQEVEDEPRSGAGE